MSYKIDCPACKKETFAANIIELIEKCRNEDGYFKCLACGSKGYISKEFKLQEDGEEWKPYLRGIIKLGEKDNTYQPFVYLVSDEPEGPILSQWFCYYKYTEHENGIKKLKLGHGPGGPPVLGKDKLLELVKSLKKLNIITQEELQKI
jgi:hypothetical protein